MLHGRKYDEGLLQCCVAGCDDGLIRVLCGSRVRRGLIRVLHHDGTLGVVCDMASLGRAELTMSAAENECDRRSDVITCSVTGNKCVRFQ